MNNDNLDTLSDAELSEAFAVECAGFVDEPNFPHMFWLGPDGCMEAKQTEDGEPVDFFATSADAVLPILDKTGRWTSDYSVTSEPPGAEHHVRLYLGTRAFAPTFARAACIALLRAKRAEKGQP